MAKKKNTPPEKLLTQVELELMSILWKMGAGTVHDVLEQLPPQRALAYTSVSTVLRILETKGFLDTRKEGRGHQYLPAISKTSYESTTVQDVVTRVFDGTPTTLVRRLLEVGDLSRDDLREIQALLEEKLT
jgi:predicted transcriptional regulator